MPPARSSSSRPRPPGAHLRRQYRLRPLRLALDPRGAHRGAPASPPAQPRLRGRRAVPGRDRPRGDAAARERTGEGLLGRAPGHRRAARRVPQPRRAAARAEPRLRRRQRRPGAAGASRAAADRRGRGHVRGGAPLGRRGPGAGRPGARAAAGEGRALARQRHAVHGRLRRARRDPRRPDREDRRHRLRALARGAPGLAHELPAADSRAAAAEGPVGLGCERAPAARGLGDQRVASLVRPGAGRLLAPLRAAGARRFARPARLRAADGRRRAQRRHRQPARARRRRDARLERELPRPAAGARARRDSRSRSPSSRTSPSGASSGSSTRASRAGCRRS